VGGVGCRQDWFCLDLSTRELYIKQFTAKNYQIVHATFIFRRSSRLLQQTLQKGSSWARTVDLSLPSFSHREVFITATSQKQRTIHHMYKNLEYEKLLWSVDLCGRWMNESNYYNILQYERGKVKSESVLIFRFSIQTMKEINLCNVVSPCGCFPSYCLAWSVLALSSFGAEHFFLSPSYPIFGGCG
jgi:hypothetical protein